MPKLFISLNRIFRGQQLYLEDAIQDELRSISQAHQRRPVSRSPPGRTSTRSRSHGRQGQIRLETNDFLTIKLGEILTFLPPDFEIPGMNAFFIF